jgi:hypothetical protein
MLNKCHPLIEMLVFLDADWQVCVPGQFTWAVYFPDPWCWSQSNAFKMQVVHATAFTRVLMAI